MDVVYPVRPGEANEELRYSLRSLERNFPNVGTVWIVGHKPSWLQNVEFIPGNDGPSGHANVYRNILTAMQHKRVSDEVVVFNDDFFVTAPITHLPVMYRGTLDEHLSLPRIRVGGSQNWWRESLKTTKVCLQAVGIPAPLSYELHVPLPCHRQAMRDTLERFAGITPENPPQWRTLYGNLHVDGATLAEDPKSASAVPRLRTPFLSTSDASWPSFRRKVMDLFPEPSSYETTSFDPRRRPSVVRRSAPLTLH